MSAADDEVATTLGAGVTEDVGTTTDELTWAAGNTMTAGDTAAVNELSRPLTPEKSAERDVDGTTKTNKEGYIKILLGSYYYYYYY